MSASYTIKTFSTYPPLPATLSDADGVIDLTTAVSVTLFLKGSKGGVITGNCDVAEDPTLGQVTYSWQPGDTDIADIYEVEFKITWNEGGDERVPNAAANNPTIEIDDSLDGAIG